jgi:hypothetical protein
MAEKFIGRKMGGISAAIHFAGVQNPGWIPSALLLPGQCPRLIK